MLYLYLILGLLTIADLYPADLQERKLSLEEISKQVAFLTCQTETFNQRLDKIETQMEKLKKYDRKLSKEIKGLKEIISEKLPQIEKAIKDLHVYHVYNEDLVKISDDHYSRIKELTLGRSLSCPELIIVNQRLDIQEKQLLELYKQIQKNEVEQRSIKEDLQLLTKRQYRSEEKSESINRELEQLKRAKR